MDGKAADCQLVDRASKEEDKSKSEKDKVKSGATGKDEGESASAKSMNAEGVPSRGNEGGEVRDYWYVWATTFKAKTKSTHVVKYVLDLDHQHCYHCTGYVLHTGSPWKNPIKHATVTLTYGGNFVPDQVGELSPAPCTRTRDSVIWNFENFEPTKKDDIVIPYDRFSACEHIEQAREEAKGRWTGKWELVQRLHDFPQTQGRQEMTDAELADFLATIESLISELKTEDGKVVMPGTESGLVIDGETGLPNWETAKYHGPQRRPYADSVETYGIFKKLFDMALNAANTHPQNDTAKTVLKSYRAFMQHFVDNDLYLDLRSRERGKQGDGTLFHVPALKNEECAALKEALSEADKILSGTDGKANVNPESENTNK